jgi:hypothetical protein
MPIGIVTATLPIALPITSCNSAKETTNVNYSISGSPTIAYGGSITITATATNPQGDYI